MPDETREDDPPSGPPEIVMERGGFRVEAHVIDGYRVLRAMPDGSNILDMSAPLTVDGLEAAAVRCVYLHSRFDLADPSVADTPAELPD